MSAFPEHVVVTGASSGIGKATAALIARQGVKVTLIARRKDALLAAQHEIGTNAAIIVADVTDFAALEAALAEAESCSGPIGGLFANAGSGGNFAPVQEYALDDWDRVMAINVTSVFRAVRRVLPGMYARGTGTVLVTGSLASERGMANNAAYVASKHAVLGLARAIAIEAAPHGVRCNCIVPGFIDTPMMDELPPGAKQALGARVPQGRIGSAEEMAKVAAFLLSDAASHVTGQCWAVDGGVLGTLSVN